MVNSFMRAKALQAEEQVKPWPKEPPWNLGGVGLNLTAAVPGTQSYAANTITVGR
jgi:hypothetical protein